MSFNYKLIKKDIKTLGPFPVIAVLFIMADGLVAGGICPIRHILGIPCPGCGMTRALLLALKGDFVGATKMHFFWIFVALLILAFLVMRYILPGERWHKYSKILKRVAVVLLALMILYYIYRMLTVFPDREPMVYNKDSLIYRVVEFYLNRGRGTVSL